jgi:hypothetical protein
MPYSIPAFPWPPDGWVGRPVTRDGSPTPRLSRSAIPKGGIPMARKTPSKGASKNTPAKQTKKSAKSKKK